MAGAFVHYPPDGPQTDCKQGNDPGWQHPSSTGVLMRRVAVAVRPVAALFVALIALTALWMRANSAGTLPTHIVAFVTILGMMFGTFLVLWRDFDGPQASWSLGRDILLVLVTPVAWAYWRGRINTPAENGLAKQLQSNRTTQLHGKVLVWFVGVALWLGFAGFAHEAVEAVLSHFQRSDMTPTKVISFLTGLATVVGSLFTVLKAMPTAGGDARAIAPLSLVTRVILAVTPLLVLIVLAFINAWLSFQILHAVLSDFKQYVPWLVIAAFLGIALCLLFAVFELSEDLHQRWGVRMQWACATAGLIACLLVGIGGFVASSWWSYSAWLIDALCCLSVLGLWWHADKPNRRVIRLGGSCGFALLWLLLLLLATDMPTRLAPFIPFFVALTLLIIVCSWVVAFGWMADPNALSLHTFYKVRLIRSYLGASNSNRQHDHDITEPVQGDDMALSTLTTCRNGGPYHLINTTLNLVGGRDLATAQRSAASFLLSQHYCGSIRTGYRPTNAYMAGQLTLGAAIAASGAAMSPNMGSVTPTAALALLLALLNVRLGLWVPTPHQTLWKTPQTRLWFAYLLREALSQTNDLARYCYLTDGGHFDNTALYSLVERGCRFIVLADGGADPDPCFEDIGEAIRRCRIDFGADICLDVTPFRKIEGYEVATGTDGHLHGASLRMTDGKRARQHYVVGTIQYSQQHAESLGWKNLDDAYRLGLIVWFKPSLVGDEPAALRQYGLQNPTFPQQTTADQWFGESQFESYRHLGEFCAKAFFAGHKQCFTNLLDANQVSCGALRDALLALAHVQGDRLNHTIFAREESPSDAVANLPF